MTAMRRRRPDPARAARHDGERAVVRGAVEGVGAIVAATAVYANVALVLAVVVAWLT